VSAMLKYQWINALALLLFGLPAAGQWSEDFSSGDLSAGGTAWEGNIADFVVNTAGQLQLMAPVAGSSLLYTQQFIPDSVRFDFYIHLDFSPSGSNQVGLFLAVDVPDLSTATGYYFEAGETGSADAMRFFRLTNGQRTLLASGTPGAVGGSTATVRGRLERTAQGLWTFYADYTGGNVLQEEFSVEDAAHPLGSDLWFGPRCLYTASRTSHFYFDDFAILPLLPDTTPPGLIAIEIIDEQEVHLVFDEALDGVNASDPAHFWLSPPGVAPSLALWDPAAPSRVELIWSLPFVPFQEYMVSAFGMMDRAGNTADTLTIPFTFVLARPPLPGELLINEIMANPTPVAGLPDQEFIELYNAGQAVIQMEGLRILTSSSSATLPAFQLFPDSFLLLCRPEHVSLFLPYGPTLGVPGLPALPNDGTRLRLRRGDDLLLHEVPYSSAWHTTTTKRNGGWSLELISPNRRCDLTGNWTSSVAPAGGTPGRINSVYSPETDTIGPRLLRVWPTSDTVLILTFNERLGSLPQPDWIEVDPARLILSIQLLESGFQLEVKLNQPIEKNTIYTVRALSGTTDCIGNSSSTGTSARVALPEKPQSGDLLINEVLFNPPTGGREFVEVLNNSEKVLSLEHLILGNMEPGREDTRPVNWSALVFPGDHAVFTADTAFVSTWWEQVDPALLFQMTMPTLLNQSGNVTLFFQDGPELVSLDAMDYHQDMHFTLLRDVKGVSLERLNPSASPWDRDNWQSAAEEVGFATPTRRNSQYTDLPTDVKGPFTLVSTTFSPDGDGWQDQLVVNYLFEDSGVVLNARIFDRTGRPVRELASTRLLGREGLLTWDGATDNGQAAGPGPYILWLETFTLDGRVRQYKLPFVLAVGLR
jgi:hypothetical protein